MLLSDFKYYSEQYVDGAKKIAFRSSRPNIDSDNSDVKIIKSYGNFDLYFNELGTLIHSEHFEKSISEQIIYCYDSLKNLILAVVLSSVKHELIFRSEFEYDSKNRIKNERCYVFYNSMFCTGVSELKHKYSANKETIIESTNPEDNEQNSLVITYDKDQNPVETKYVHSTKDRCYWHKNIYDKNGVLVKRHILDEYGQTFSIIEYKLNSEKGTSPSYIRVSRVRDFIKDNTFIFNDRGHWINNVVLLNGDTSLLVDRTIDYY